MVSPKLLAALAALYLAVGSEAGVCRPQTTTALSITTSNGATTASTTSTTSASTETVSVTSPETSVVSSETSSSADTSEPTTETASTSAQGTTSATEGTTTTAETTLTTAESNTLTTKGTTSTAEDTTSTTQGTTTTTGTASTTSEDTSSTTDGTTTTEAASTTTTRGPLPPTVTAKVTLKMPPGFAFTLALKDENNYLMAHYAAEDTFTFIREGGTVTLGPDGSKKLVLYNPDSDKAIIRLMTEATAAVLPHEDITCSLADDDTISCEAPSVGFADLYLCGSYIYLGKPGLEDGWCYVIDGNIRMASS
ncbi:hypothetical protein N0V84_007165 [Fusarium piperis]|uniref:Uncharacterized protein n=1 Tax=Fusarium piperis TaxID=1435070 RepID=A0A9W8WAI1_9HYPO|nr:hypothetical protein N0V84_007165 [Fusarium piperis]